MDDSDASSVLSDPPTSDEEPLQIPEPQRKIKLNVSKPSKSALKQSTLSFGSRCKSPSESPEPDPAALGRECSPPHEYGLADNPDIAIIVMFQSRFNDAFLRGVPNLGPQDIEAGVVAEPPSDAVEDLLCGLLGLVLNRKKNPERGHYGRALEEALASQKPQWPPHWNGVNPVPSSKTFASLSAERRIDLMKTLVHWSLTSSEAVSNMIRDHYKGTRKDCDSVLDCPPWGQDTLKRKFYLVEGQIDTPTRVYREGNRKLGHPTWQSVAGDVAGVQRLARDLRGEQSVAARSLADRMTKHIGVLEAREEKRKRREYRQNRKNHWTRPDPGFSLYEGRTRGHRPKYNFDDDEIYGTDTSTRRSVRQSGVSTPTDGPRYTASGRQVRSTYGTSYGEPSRLRDGISLTPESSGADYRRDGRPSRSSRATGLRGSSFDEGYESVDNANGADVSSGEEWNGDDEDGNDARSEDEANDSDISLADSLAGESQPRSLVVKLKCGQRLASLHKARHAVQLDDAMHVDDAGGKDVTHTATLPLSPKKPPQNTLLANEPGEALKISQYAYQPQPTEKHAEALGERAPPIHTATLFDHQHPNGVKATGNHSDVVSPARPGDAPDQKALPQHSPQAAWP